MEHPSGIPNPEIPRLLRGMTLAEAKTAQYGDYPIRGAYDTLGARIREVAELRALRVLGLERDDGSQEVRERVAAERKEIVAWVDAEAGRYLAEKDAEALEERRHRKVTAEAMEKMAAELEQVRQTAKADSEASDERAREAVVWAQRSVWVAGGSLAVAVIALLL